MTHMRASINKAVHSDYLLRLHSTNYIDKNNKGNSQTISQNKIHIYWRCYSRHKMTDTN